MDDEGDDDPVPLPNVNAAILKKVEPEDASQNTSDCRLLCMFIVTSQHGDAQPESHNQTHTTRLTQPDSHNQTHTQTHTTRLTQLDSHNQTHTTRLTQLDSHN